MRNLKLISLKRVLYFAFGGCKVDTVAAAVGGTSARFNTPQQPISVTSPHLTCIHLLGGEKRYKLLILSGRSSGRPTLLLLRRLSTKLARLLYFSL